MVKVLVVERDPVLARLYCEELEEAGFGVSVKADFGSAIGDLNSNSYSVIVTDLASIGRPLDMWLPRLRSFHKGPVIALTPGRGRYRACKGLAYLDKSSDLKPLINQLRGQALVDMWSSAAGNA